MRVTFDSNTWEKVFTPGDYDYAAVRAALINGRMEGFICDAGFRIEAIMKRDRPPYFAQPHMDVAVAIQIVEGRIEVSMSLGPDDKKHPGLPQIQMTKMRSALTTGVKVMRGHPLDGIAWPTRVA